MHKEHQTPSPEQLDKKVLAVLKAQRGLTLSTLLTVVRGAGHPAAYPLDLVTRHIETWSVPGELVLDPFSGSGTTAKAAKTLGRQFIGLEVNPEYCAIAEQRIAQGVLELA